MINTTIAIRRANPPTLACWLALRDCRLVDGIRPYYGGARSCCGGYRFGADQLGDFGATVAWRTVAGQRSGGPAR